jgi:molecular chaperone DnaK
MNDIVVGIDLGTSNSVISVVLEGEPIVIPDESGNRIQPSIVYFHEDGTTEIGNAAVPYLLKDPTHTVYSAKRLIGRPFDSPDLRVLIGSFPFKIVSSGDGAPRINMYGAMHPPEGISARVLAHLKSLAEGYLGMPVSKAVITVPANFDEGQRRATKRSGELAGLEVLRLINEPTAAALAYGYGQSRRERVAIYDFGGGTFDITILELRGNVFQVLSTAGNSYLGGDDFDNRLVTSMLNAFEKQYGYDLSGEDAIRHRLKAVAQDVKHKLSGQDVVTARVSEMVPGTLTELELEFSLSRDAFNKRCVDIVDTSMQTCEEALQLAGLQNAEIDHLVLVGGTTRVPLVQRRVEQFFNRRAEMNINPDEVVSIGAAIFGHSMVQEMQAPPPTVDQHAVTDEHFADDAWLEELDDEPTQIRDQAPPPPRSQRTGTQPGQRPGPPPTPGSGPPAQPQAPPQQPRQQRPPQPRQQRPPQNQAPVLIDVTPHALGVATVGGVMDIIIERNGSIPLARTRMFSTSRDDQTRVVLPIFSGNSRRIEDNRQLGTLELNDIPPGPREECQIEVTFEVDTNGMLNVRATDMRTGANQVARLSIMGETEDMSYYDADDLLM